MEANELTTNTIDVKKFFETLAMILSERDEQIIVKVKEIKKINAEKSA